MEKTVKPLFSYKIYHKNYKFDSNSIQIDNGVTLFNDEKTAGIQYFEKFIFARIPFYYETVQSNETCNRKMQRSSLHNFSKQKSTSVENPIFTLTHFSQMSHFYTP